MNLLIAGMVAAMRTRAARGLIISSSTHTTCDRTRTASAGHRRLRARTNITPPADMCVADAAVVEVFLITW